MTSTESFENKLAVTISLKYKFALFSSALILCVCATLSLFLMGQIEDELNRQIRLRGMSSITNFSQNVKYSMTTQNRAFIKTLIESEINKEDVHHVIIIDQKGVIIGHNNPSLIGKRITDEYTQNFLENLNEPTYRKIPTSSGIKVYDFVMPITESDIYTTERYSNPIEARQRMQEGRNLGLLRIGISFEKMETSIQKTYSDVVKITLAICLVAIILAFLYGKVVSKPLIEMTRIANRLATGYLDERVNIQGTDEISVLANNFNTMAQSLQESRSNLWKLNKDLEFMVEERTQELLTAYAELQELDKLKTSFLSTVSHELRTPLTSILGFAKMIDKQFNRHIIPNLPEDNKKTTKAKNTIGTNLDIITQESNRLARLINDVLDLAKIESGKMSFNFEDLQLEQLFERAFNNLSSLTEQSNIELELKYAHTKPSLIQGDRDRILQVMTNLISNAIKFTKDGRITCRVEMKEHWIQCSVKDTGIGIVEEDLLKVFDKFQQVGDTLTDKPQGTGLGLPICREIIEIHHGQIWADSKPNKGSTFYFALPFDQSSPVPETVKEVTFKLEDKLDKMEKSEYLILIADEDEGVRDLIKISLENEGYRTIQAVNGKEAYDLAREYPVNAIIIDIMMYDIDGFDTPHYLKSDDLTKDIPIVLLSIILNHNNEMVLGANTYVTDPIDSEKILDRLNEIVRDTHSSLSTAKASFVGFSRNNRRGYQTELKNMGITVEHYDTSSQFQRSLETDLPTAIFIDFKDFDLTPNQFFKMVKKLDRTRKLPVIAVIHAGQVAQVIDAAPIKGLCSTIDVTNSINELFGKRIRG